MTAFKEFVHAVVHNFFHFRFLQCAMLLIFGLMYVYRKVKHEWVLRTKCGTCGGSTRVYFMRSPLSVYGAGDPTELYDWIICRDEDCAIATPLGG